MALADLTFKLGDNGIVLNGEFTDDTVTDGLSIIDIERVTGLSSASYRETRRDHEGTDGGFIDAEFEQGRSVILEGTVYSQVGIIEKYLDRLKQDFAPVRNSIPLFLKAPGKAEQVIFVKPLGVRYDWTTSRRLGQEPIQFEVFAEDPRIYDSTLQTINIPLGGLVTSGFGFPYGFPYGFGATPATPDGRNVVNGGNRPAPALFRINGPATNPQIRSDEANASLRFNIVLSSTDFLEIDLGLFTVKLNGTSNRLGTLISPDWFMLKPGDNFIRYIAEAATGSSLDVEWRNAWR